MSAWLIGLSLSAAYLVQKNAQMRSRLEDATVQFNADAEPAKGLKSEEIRNVQRTIPDADKYQDMNIQDLSRADVNTLVKQREQAAQDVVEYENAGGLPPIEGVYLTFERNGV